jgi:putative membrane protein
MDAIKQLLRQRDARAALAVWIIVPALFLFFATSLAVDPAANLDELRLGAAIEDDGVSTPGGEVAIGPRLVEGLESQMGLQVTTYDTEAALREAIDEREVAAGIVVPDGSTQDLMTGGPIELGIIRTDANDPITNAFTANLAGQLAANLNAVLPTMLPGAEPPAPPPVTVAADTIAPTADFRFTTVMAALLLPLWMAGVAFSALLSRAGDAIRRTVGAGATAASELTAAIVGAGVVAAVLVIGLATFTWNWEIDLIGLFGFGWLGLTAIALVLLGAVRSFGLEIGAGLGVLALFVQQPVSGAAFPAAMAPDVVAWAEPVAPLRYLVEGMRNLLIGGSTTPDMVLALSVIGLVGLGVALIGYGRLAVVRRQPAPASLQGA